MTKLSNTISLILLLFLMLSCATQKSTFNIFKGNVESVEIQTYAFDELTNEKRFFSHYKYFFNEERRLIKANKYNTENGMLKGKRLYKYDKNGHQESEFYVLIDGILKGQTSTCKYDENGNFSEIYRYNPDSSLRNRIVLKYDEKGNQTEALNYTPDSILENKITIEYDKYGNQTQKKIYEYDKDGSFATRITEKYEYDRKGNRTAYYRYGRDVLEYKSFSKYNIRAYLKSQKVYLNGKELSYTEIYRYNKRGDKKIVQRYNKNGKLESTMTYEYEYDKHGNQIECRTFYNNKPFEFKKNSYAYKAGKK